ncbi:glycoside hydrolase family 97 N-terminal domain-containing protein [Micromonospora sp. SL1-18]|uniref:glycoside hydrolase family 97 N-terminal domain-containing protein n=1 Tax=Micromonospora sp. SL1-18 TaxID=3399128 RepID=UPI003A4D9498
MPEQIRGISRRTVLKATAVGGAAALPLSLAGPASAGIGAPRVVKSPDGRLLVKVFHTPAGLFWSVVHDNVEVVLRSPLGLRMVGEGEPLGAGARLLDGALTASSGSWAPPYGRFAELSTDHRELNLVFSDEERGIDFQIVARAYNQGAAIRFVLLRAPKAALWIDGETTEYRLQPGSLVWASRDESDYSRVPAHAIPQTSNGVSDVGRLADIPVTVEVPSGARISLAESAREHYPRLLLSSVVGAQDTLGAYLATSAQRGGGPSSSSFLVALPFETPWRTVTVGANASELANNADLVTLLGRPNILGDTSWIRPGKAFRTGLSTLAGIQGVDFAVARNLQYVHFDAG